MIHHDDIYTNNQRYAFDATRVKERNPYYQLPALMIDLNELDHCGTDCIVCYIGLSAEALLQHVREQSGIYFKDIDELGDLINRRNIDEVTGLELDEVGFRLLADGHVFLLIGELRSNLTATTARGAQKIRDAARRHYEQIAHEAAADPDNQHLNFEILPEAERQLGRVYGNNAHFI